MLVVVAIGLRAGLRPVAPVPVQQRAIGQPHDAAVRLARREAVGAVHPERVLGLQRVEIWHRFGDIRRPGIEPDHRGEERRLAAAEIVGAVAVRDVPDASDQVGEVIQHVLREVGATALDQPEHREVRVPVVDLPKAPARDYIGLRQRDQRGRRARDVRRPCEHRPQPADVRLHGLRGAFAFRLRHFEMPPDERGEIARRVVEGHDLRRRQERLRIHERLGVREHPRELDVLEQRAEVARGVVVARRGLRRLSPLGRRAALAAGGERDGDGESRERRPPASKASRPRQSGSKSHQGNLLMKDCSIISLVLHC